MKATETPTPDARATAVAMIQADMTETATLWTLTPTSTSAPTPDFAAAIIAERTAILRETQAAGETATAIIVASYTKTPTPTDTATPPIAPTPPFTSTPTATATSAMVTANSQWAPVIQSFDGVEMVLVPAGCFMMGSSDGEDDEKPIHQVCFSEPFWIDRTEVTNAQFAQFDGVAANASAWSDADRPRAQITWFEGCYFCAKRGTRMPTEAEREMPRPGS